MSSGYGDGALLRYRKMDRQLSDHDPFPDNGNLRRDGDTVITNRLVCVKMGLLVLILLLELVPMTTPVGWRIASRRGKTVDMAMAPAPARISHVQARSSFIEPSFERRS
ncbi:MAG: hypothetical protein ACJ731_04040 [Vicinamibacterales bacterium]